ncbi:MAG: methyltransferase domain-containing protein [Bryobacterales bacterium]|nr:methyltransferase domain-containing protein [Bryobacterales bacterium]
MARPELDRQLEKMRRDWDERARENARYFVNTAREDWTDQEFFRSGESTVREEILTDMGNICQGQDPKRMTVLEIGCGAGRVTRALAQVFGKVYGVDVSGEMIRRARQALRGVRNARVLRNNGADLTVLDGPLRSWHRYLPGPLGPRPPQFDFAFSTIVFQHIPSREVIENYVAEVHRVLRPGALFKFQVQGDASVEHSPEDTWHGVGFSDEEACAMARRHGFEPRYRHGAGGQYFWLWFFKEA